MQVYDGRCVAPCRNMWHSDDSLRAFLALAMPNDTQYLFLSYSGQKACRRYM